MRKEAVSRERERGQRLKAVHQMPTDTTIKTNGSSETEPDTSCATDQK